MTTQKPRLSLDEALKRIDVFHDNTADMEQIRALGESRRRLQGVVQRRRDEQLNHAEDRVRRFLIASLNGRLCVSVGVTFDRRRHAMGTAISGASGPSTRLTVSLWSHGMRATFEHDLTDEAALLAFRDRVVATVEAWRGY